MTQEKKPLGLLLAGAIVAAGIASIGGSRLLPLRLASSASFLALSSVLLAAVEERKRGAYLDDADVQLNLQVRQIHANARLEGEQLKAKYEAAERLYDENPWLEDYLEVSAQVVPDGGQSNPVPSGVSSNPVSPPDAQQFQPQPTATAPALTATQDVQFFDWADLKDADRHPILGVVAKMGGGKSVLVKYLGKHILNASITVFDIYGSDADWAGCEVLYDYSQMVARMADDNKMIAQDIAQYRRGQRDFPARLIVLEEGKATLKRLQSQGSKVSKIVSEWKLNYESVTRKIRRRLCQVSTNMNSDVFGSNAETRDEMTLIFPGREGVGKAMKDTSMLKLGAQQNRELRDRLTRALEGVKRPALVYSNGEWFPASIPELDNNGDPIGYAPAAAPIVPSPPPQQPQPNDVQFLESLLLKEIDEPSFDVASDDDGYEPTLEEVKTALLNAVNLLIARGQTREAKEVGSWIDFDKEQALWVAIQRLELSQTATIRDVFGFGTGGRKFIAGKQWLETLQANYGGIDE